MRLLSYIVVTVSAASILGCSTPPAPSPAYACPDWSSDSIHNYSNKDFSNYGCAHYNNLAVQVVNPADLQNGHGDLEGSGDRESAVVQKYMSATPQSLPSSSTSSGSTSSSR